MQTNQNTSEDFEISEGGLLYNVFKKTHYLNTYKKVAVLGLCIAWLPLVIICAFEGTLYSGVQMPFLYDVAMHARVLIAFPMLITIKAAIDNKVTTVLKYMGMQLLDDAERQRIVATTLRRAKRLSGSALTEIIILLIVIVSTVGLARGGAYSSLESGKTSWMAAFDEVRKLSIAGYWTLFISIPLCQYFLLRWLWRYLVWVVLLFRFSKANIQLMPTHADRAGGLGIIMIAQRSFNLFFVAVSVILSGELTATLLINPDAFNTIRSEAIGFIVLCLILLIFPLVFFSGKLFKIKNEELLRMGNLSTHLSRKFEREWVNGQPVDKILEQQQLDPSLIYDYSGMYDSLQELRVVPIRLQDILGMGLVLFLPFTPILFIHYSIAELLQKIGGIVM